METNTEPVDPLNENVSALPEVSGTVAMEDSSDGEDEAENADLVTETVMNGSMKETLSLTVDAKTETAVFKSEDGKLTTSQDVVCKYVVVEDAEAAVINPTTSQPASDSQEHRTDQQLILGDASTNGPV